MFEPAIHVKDLVKNYGAVRALKGINLEVPKGDFLAFLGPNGAGKTTTISAITGLCNFTAGAVKVFGLDVVRDYRKTRALIGLCPQEFNLDPFLNIQQVLVYQAGYFGIPKGEAFERSQRLLKQFRLYEKREVDFRKLSGGMKRRLLICRSLIHEPEILILDEPTAGADVELKHSIWATLSELNRKGKTIFLTTHYMEEAERLAKTVVIIHEGRIIHHGGKDALVKDGRLEETFLKLTQGKTDD